MQKGQLMSYVSCRAVVPVVCEAQSFGDFLAYTVEMV